MKRLAFGFALFACALSSTAALAQTCSWTTLTNGTTADATQVMGNFNCLAPLASPSFTGNIGIGTATPGGHGSGASGPYLDVFKSGGTAEMYIGSDATADGSVTGTYGSYTTGSGSADQRGGLMVFANDGSNATNTNGQIRFYTANAGTLTQRMTVTKDGYVGIGTTSPVYKLDVFAANYSGLRVTAYSNPSYSSAIVVDNNGGTAYMHMATIGSSYGRLQVQNSAGYAGLPLALNPNGGNIGIGTSTPAQLLDVAGTIRQSGCTTAGTLSANTSGDIICTSDARLKSILGGYTGGLDVIAKITPQRFTYKPTHSDPVETFVHAGFIAQNVKAVIPEASALQRDGYYSLDTTAILAASVNAIKELKIMNDRQEGVIKRMQEANDHQLAEIKQLQTQIHALEGIAEIRTAAR